MCCEFAIILEAAVYTSAWFYWKTTLTLCQTMFDTRDGKFQDNSIKQLNKTSHYILVEFLVQLASFKFSTLVWIARSAGICCRFEAIRSWRRAQSNNIWGSIIIHTADIPVPRFNWGMQGGPWWTRSYCFFVRQTSGGQATVVKR